MTFRRKFRPGLTRSQFFFRSVTDATFYNAHAHRLEKMESPFKFRCKCILLFHSKSHMCPRQLARSHVSKSCDMCNFVNKTDHMVYYFKCANLIGCSE